MQLDGLVAGSGKLCAVGVCSLVSRVPEGVCSNSLVAWSGKRVSEVVGLDSLVAWSGKVGTGGRGNLGWSLGYKWECSQMILQLYEVWSVRGDFVA